ncbi:hypothetical protein [Limosilactobacillus sp.]|uniref:hypothetical protein n=1 Tax=Limosilactobacillus sp. TaxID=2773925 RepID=UPI003EFF287C
MYRVIERHLVAKHLKNLRAAHLLKTYQKIRAELATNPFSTTHHFELLEKRRPRPNLYSKRISQSNRVVYSVDQKRAVIVVYSAWGHYASGNQSLIHHRL